MDDEKTSMKCPACGGEHEGLLAPPYTASQAAEFMRILAAAQEGTLIPLPTETPAEGDASPPPGEPEPSGSGG